MTKSSLWMVGLIAAGVWTGGCSKKSGSSDSAGTPVTPSATTVPGPSAAGALSVDDAKVLLSNSQLAMAGSLALIQSSDGAASLRLSADGPGGDYAADAPNVRIQDDTLRALDTVNQILCMIGQTKFWDDHVVNNGNYIAQVNVTSCGMNKGGGDPNASKQVQMINFTVDSTRAAEAPLAANMWFTMPAGGDDEPTNIAIRILVAEGASAKNPIGIFRMQFILNPPAGSNAQADTGFLESKRASADGDILIDFSEQNPNADKLTNDRLGVQLKIDPATNKIVAGWLNEDSNESYTDNGQTKSNASKFKIAYGSGKFLGVDANTGDSVCKDTDNFTQNIYQYGLYDAGSGARISLAHPSFPIRVARQDGSVGHGNAGYYGIWIPQDVTLTNGMEIISDNAAKKVYSLVTGPGQLTKHTVSQFASMDDLDGVALQAYLPEGQSLVSWSKATHKFTKTATIQNGNNGPQTTPVTPTDFALTPHQTTNFFAPNLNAQVTIATDNSGAPTTASYDMSTNVTGQAADGLVLHCWQNCTATPITDGNNPYIAGTNMFDMDTHPTLGSPVNYTWDASTYTLKHDGQSSMLADGATFPQWGVQSGAMVDDATYAAMTSAGASPYAAGQQTTFYSWMIGKESYNQFQGLKDGASIVTFDAPIQIDFVATEANGAIAPAHPGQSYRLCWTGDGNMCIPGVGDEHGYTPDFSLADGVHLGANNAYIAKGLNGEKYMKALDAAQCAGLDTSTVPELPSASSFDIAKANTLAAPDASALVPLFVQGVYVGE